MDFAHGFALRRELGTAVDGSFLPFAALTAIHYAHRLAAYLLLAALALLAWRLRASGDPALGRWSVALGGVALWQLASGLGNVVLGWPLVAALAHTGGAAALLALLAVMLSRAAQAGRRTEAVSRSRAPPMSVRRGGSTALPKMRGNP
jgi:cytochrome c oxidase assembly protein subunit 15